MIELRVLGALDVRADRPDGTPGVLTQPKRLALLVYLTLAEPPGLHARERLLAMLWPEADDASSRHSLRNALHGLRQGLGEETIVTRGDAFVGLDFTLLRCDALDLRAHIAAGRVDDAMALWKGDLAPGFHISGAPDFEHWLEEQRGTLRREVRAAAWKRSQELAGEGEAELDAVRRAVQLDPGDEPGARRLMRLLDAAGDRGGALQAYQRVADYLARELDAQPSAETSALASRLRSAPAKRPSLPGSPAPAPDPGTNTQTTGVTPPERLAAKAGRRIPDVAIAGGAVLAIALFLVAYFSSRPASASPARAMPAFGAAAEAERAVLRLPARYREDTSAYSSYLRGLTLRFRFRFLESRDTLASLVNGKPLYVPGLYGLAHAYGFTAANDLTDRDESWLKIDALARRALALDSTAASAWLALAAADMLGGRDMSRARERIARAAALDSLEPEVASLLSVWFRFHGQMDSAVAEARRAHRLDPLSELFGRLLGKQLYFARRYDESRRVFEQMLRDDPGWKRGYSDLAELYRAMGRPRDAVEWFRKVAVAAGDSARAAALPPASTDSAARRLLAADARRTITQLDRATKAGKQVSLNEYASAYAVLRDTVRTLRWLDSMTIHSGSYLHQVRVDPKFDFLRRDARYRAWESRSGLPPLAPSHDGRN